MSQQISVSDAKMLLALLAGAFLGCVFMYLVSRLWKP